MQVLLGFQDESACVCGGCGTKSDAVTAGSPGVLVCVCVCLWRVRYEVGCSHCRFFWGSSMCLRVSVEGAV